MNYSGTNYCWPLYEKNVNFRDVLHALSGGCARVPILGKVRLFESSKKRPLVRFITRSDILKFVVSHFDYFSDQLEVTVTDAGVGITNNPCWLVDQDKLAIDAFREICRHQVNAVGVVNEQGKLIGNLSVRDIRFAMFEPQETLQKTVKDFLDHVIKEDPESSRHSRLVTITPEQSVRDAVMLMSYCRIHRVWILDENGFPKGVISISDICRFISKLNITDLVQQKASEKIAIQEVSDAGTSTDSLVNYDPTYKEESNNSKLNKRYEISS